MLQDYDQGTMSAFDITMAMKPIIFYINPFFTPTNILDANKNDKTYDCFTAILESKYEKANVQDVANHQTHLTKEQCDGLHTLFKKQTKLFSGKFGSYSFKKIDLELLPNAKPIHAKPYPVPRIHLEVF
jgi:hypothetical protein